MINEELQAYIEGKIHHRTELLQEIESFAHDEKVPIMELIGIEALLQILRIQNPKTILEVGAAIGYSALRMSLALPDAKIVTIERDEERAKMAENYIGRAGRTKEIILIKGDALEVEDIVKKYGPFDAIFIDAAKGQYQRFFEMYSRLLNENGIIITDNILFKGLVCQENIENKRIRSLVRKIDGFNDWLMNLPNFDTAILPVGDGIAISKKR
ncbi:O-methyltransferase [Bacillus sp. CGMCC 1.16607]|uniref:O-methyltransferase n=1 Tax=Bacillus sp. CGMCC 1.16607 TaxID=3351842 RepID=UPI00363BE1EF